MTLYSEFTLSYYKEVAVIRQDRDITLVQHVQTGIFYVKKVLTVYSLPVFQQLQAFPVKGTPRIYELVEENGTLTVIEEFIPGQTLQQELDSHGPLPEPAVLDIAIQLCGILSALHSQHPPIIHRDIKPSNIICTSDGIIKLLDMDAAKQCRKDSAQDTMLLGTQGYAAPEQYGFGASGIQTDIYAVGVLMNVLLTGQLPGERMAGGRFREIIRRCIELEPGKRYPSIAALREALIPRDETAPQKKSWQRFLPPGFRRGNPGHMLIALCGYAMTLFLGLNLSVTDGTPWQDFCCRVTLTPTFLLMALYTGNYLDIQQRAAIFRSKNPILKLLNVLLVNFLLMVLGVLAFGILGGSASVS